MVLFLMGGAGILNAREPFTPTELAYKNSEAFRPGVYEVTIGPAVYFSPFIVTDDYPTYDYAVAVANFGYMLSQVREWGIARGNVEFVGEAFLGGVFVGRGNYIAGSTAWMRYNFVQRDWKAVPYFQVGWGIAAVDFDQTYFGQVFSFNMDAAIGCRYFLRPDMALSLEYRFQHLSNANVGDNNLGINSQGALLGISWFF